VVNGILVEKGFEDYRHKLTRVGMPIHEVTALIETKVSAQDLDAIISKAGQTVLGEYTLLNIFPRDIADAHLSGAIHIDGLGTWILKPYEVIHDLRYFFQHGVKLDDPLKVAIDSPTDLESALSITFNLLLHGSKETNRTQILNYFNVFLAPYVRANEVLKIKENLRLFIQNLNQHVDATLELELSIPKLAAEKDAIGPQGKTKGKYGGFAPESQLIASLIVDVFKEESKSKPLFNPKIVIKINSDTLVDENAKAILLKTHELAANSGLPYFANMTRKESENTAFSSSGVKFAPDLTGDWETDILRTGCLGCVTINLPRIALECGRDKNKFYDLMRERFELAARTLSIKNNALKQFGKNSLRFLLQKADRDTYFRLENCSRIINLAGFREAIEVFTEKSINSEEGQNFAEETILKLLAFKQKVGRKYGRRLYPVILGDAEASGRLAQLDIEKYGIAKVKFSGTREKPYYSTVKRFQAKTADLLNIPSEMLEAAKRWKRLNAGGTLTIIELEGIEYKPEALMDLTRRLMENQTLEFFIYNRLISFCDNCKKNWFGTLHKCPSCGSMSTLTTFDRFTST
jgi:anaerobic ribonucleoside-triphosphate reductase